MQSVTLFTLIGDGANLGCAVTLTYFYSVVVLESGAQALRELLGNNERLFQYHGHTDRRGLFDQDRKVGWQANVDVGLEMSRLLDLDLSVTDTSRDHSAPHVTGCFLEHGSSGGQVVVETVKDDVPSGDSTGCKGPLPSIVRLKAPVRNVDGAG